MTLADFKAFCLAKKRGDIKLPDTNEAYKPLIQESLEYIAKNTTPIDLVTDDTTVETLRWLNASQLIRKPIAPSLDTDKIDIDEQLTYAVAYDLISRRSVDMVNATRFETDRDNEISSYEWNNYKFLKEIGAIK